MIRRSTLNFLVDLLALVAMLVMIATGLVIRFVLPPGTGGRHGAGGLLLWNMDRHEWGDLHFWAAIALVVLLIVHVALHWDWVCATLHQLVRGKEAAQPSGRRRDAYGIAFLAAIVVLSVSFLWYADNAVERTQREGQRRGRDVETSKREAAETTMPERGVGHHAGHEAGHESIRGSMTLAEIQEATGVPVEVLKRELGVNPTISSQERIGRLARRYGLSMDQVRHIIERQQALGAPRNVATDSAARPTPE